MKNVECCAWRKLTVGRFLTYDVLLFASCLDLAALLTNNMTVTFLIPGRLVQAAMVTILGPPPKTLL